MPELLGVWDGNTVSTHFFDVFNSIDWEGMLDGSKTQTRSIKRLVSPRIGRPGIAMARYGGSYVPFVVTRIERVLLGTITEEDVIKEGHADLPSFKRFWCSKNGVSHFSNHERVWMYEFHRLDPNGIKNDEAGFQAVRTLLESIYPFDLE